MKAIVTPHPLAGELAAVASKSYAHRLLIAAALSGGSLSYGDSEDASLTAHALHSLGFKAEFAERSVHYGDFEKKEGCKEVFVGESGSTLRFLLPLAAALGVETHFQTAGRLSERPMDALTEALSAHGVQATPQGVKGRLLPGVFTVDATVSSQFVTGLLMALPILSGDSEIVLLGKTVSAPYIEITLEVLSSAGIEIARTERGFFVKGNQTYRLQKADVPGDFSGAAFFLTAGALGKGVCLSGLDPENAQGDKAILSLIQKAGGSISETSGGILSSGGSLKGFRADVGETPDLAPILSVLAAFAEGESVLEHVSRLRDKESDRLFAIRDMLLRAGIETKEGGDSLVITGGKVRGAAFESFSDHRMAMSEAILAAFAEGKSTITDMECVKKSYPTFWEEFARLGGRYEVER